MITAKVDVLPATSIDSHADSAGPGIFGLRFDRDQTLDELWLAVNRLGWLSPTASQIVIQVGDAWPSPTLIEIVQSLGSYLARNVERAKVSVLDCEDRVKLWDPLAVRDVAIEKKMRIRCMSRPPELIVPKLWFESSFVITVACIEPDPISGISSILDCQAATLRRLQNPQSRQDLIYETHRLFSSDLAIAYTPIDWTMEKRSIWYGVTPSALALEREIARIAGIHGKDLPGIANIARHEVLPLPPVLIGEFPRLSDLAMPKWRTQIGRRFDRLRALRHAAMFDIKTVRTNLKKIPRALRRRLTAAFRKEIAQ